MASVNRLEIKKAFIVLALFIIGLFMVSKTISSSKNQDLSPTKQGDYENSISLGGRMRTYLLHIPPAYDHTKPLPLVIVLHGGGR
jgi:poly(3-hydroxybutyrate) depolymerase